VSATCIYAQRLTSATRRLTAFARVSEVLRLVFLSSYEAREGTAVTEILCGTFMERHFGGLASDVSAALVAAGLEAHARSLDAKIGSRLRSNHPYGGTYWLALPDEVVARLLPLLEDSVPFPPAGSQYDLVLWNQIAILPVKVIDGGTRGGVMRVRSSELRSRLTSVNVPVTPEPTLLDHLDGFGVDEFDDEALAAVERARKALGDVATTIVVAAYACNPTSGLQAIEVGIATLDDDGFIQFSDSQRLAVIKPSVAPTRPMPVAGDSFDAAPRPKPTLGLIEEDKTASGDDEPDDKIDATELK
jgi:hypothetical protein